MIFACSVLAPCTQARVSYTVLHSFADGSVTADGVQPAGAPIFGHDGCLYGVASSGGTANKGVLYRATVNGKITILHSFGCLASLSDGATPCGSVVEDPKGDIYGVTEAGGKNGCGTIYRLSSDGNFTVIHSFGGTNPLVDGKLPLSGLVQAYDGNFFGMTHGGGSNNFGTVYCVTPSGQETVVHSFGDPSTNNDGKYPGSCLVQGADGNLYGTTDFGGQANCGSFFKISVDGAIDILYSFGANGSNGGVYPKSGVIQGHDGNFYGTCYLGGAGHNGTVFAITPTGNNYVIHSFVDGNVDMDGYFVTSGLLEASDGGIYGTTYYGGADGAGTVFEISQSRSETILHSFAEADLPKDGSNSNSALIEGPDNCLYGTTQFGGAKNAGTLFKIQTVNVQSPSFDLTVNPSEVTISPGGRTQYTVTITPKNGFEGTINLSSGVKPTFLDVQFDNTQVYVENAPTVATVTVTAGDGAMPGKWSPTIVATSDYQACIDSVPVAVTHDGQTKHSEQSSRQ